jgi:hypothetical protein
MILFGFPIGKIEAAVPTIEVPGPYPYEQRVRIPAPAIVESSAVPTPAPFPYPEGLPSLPAAQDHDSRVANARPPVTAKAAREAAFKYNGVPEFCAFLAALPADVSVFDPNLGRTRTLVKGGRVISGNVAWLRKDKKVAHKQNRTVVTVEELHSGI